MSYTSEKGVRPYEVVQQYQGTPDQVALWLDNAWPDIGDALNVRVAYGHRPCSRSIRWLLEELHEQLAATVVLEAACRRSPRLPGYSRGADELPSLTEHARELINMLEGPDTSLYFDTFLRHLCRHEAAKLKAFGTLAHLADELYRAGWPKETDVERALRQFAGEARDVSHRSSVAIVNVTDEVLWNGKRTKHRGNAAYLTNYKQVCNAAPVIVDVTGRLLQARLYWQSLQEGVSGLSPDR